jgi:hypothetical protein
MNNKTRDEISGIIERLENNATVIFYLLEFIACDERDKRENAPENLYDSERYERMEEIADSIDEAIEQLREVVY